MSEITEIQSGLRAFIGYLMSGTSDVSDVAQEVNLLLWQKRDQYEAGTNFRAWAFTIARYAVLGHLRKKRRGNVEFFSPELLEQLADEWQEDECEYEEQLTALESCLDQLPDEDLDLVHARYNSHGGVERFAQRMGLSAGSLRLRLFRLRAALKRCVEQNMGEEGNIV
ncbi:sigma-70 family RNA polymerase sigma factor [Verrucomicrobiaceae bacterium R5-34]|nr:sigma-70 family RNA polymerase sigma factor [Verrucomicrobiaceae bacterium R5-34]